MATIPPARTDIQQEDVAYKAAVSEATGTKVGQSINFINARQHSEKQFFINGIYNTLTLPIAFVDGQAFFQYDAEIIDVWMFLQVAGSSGTTELDLKWTNDPTNGSYSSIFTTTPKIQSAAGSFVFIHVGSAIANTTAPVLSKTQFAAGDSIRCDLIQAQAGSPESCGIVIHYRPR